MRRDLWRNIAAGLRKQGRYSIICIVIALGISVSITACGQQELMNIATSSADMKDEKELMNVMDNDVELSSISVDSQELPSSMVEDSRELPLSTPEDRVEPLSEDTCLNEKILSDIGDDPQDIKWIESIEENVILSDDTEIEACEWVDEEKNCLRVRVQYREEPPDNYRHKEDYFFFSEGENIQVLHVEYPTKDWENRKKDRYVWDACDFAAHFEDVTFDGREDLVIFLGHAGSRGDLIHGVYVYEDGFYHYISGFEDIPNYEADTKEQVIRGWNINNAVSSTTYVYKYQNGDFELISYEDYDTDVPGLNSFDIFP